VELKAILSNYIDSTALAQSKNKRMVQINVALASLYPPNAPELSNEFHKRDELANRLIASCSPYYKFIYPSGEESKPKSGAPPRVNVVMEKRQGKKTVTRCWGLEPFGVDPKQLGEELQRVCAGSASTSQAVGAKVGVMEILVQGSQLKAVEKALEKRGVASRFISVVDKTGGKK
jgi:translation initiation factor 2D